MTIMSLTILNKEKQILHKQDNFQPLPVITNVPKTFEIQDHLYWKNRTRETTLPGIRFSEHHITVHTEINLISKDRNALPAIFFIRQGEISSRFSYHERPVKFTRGSHSFLYNAFSSDNSLLKKQDKISLFIVSFSPDYFLQLAESVGRILEPLATTVATGNPAIIKQHHSLSISRKMQEVIGDISSCTYEGGLKKLYLQSKALELLSMHCAQANINSDARVEKYKLSSYDISKIYLARDMLLSNFSDPPSLTGLVKLTGLNEFKLKAGFRTVFSNSVFGYLNDYRMERCRTEILNTKKPLREIGYEAGFGSPAHFSSAFKKKFGISPRLLR
jgi:AraC-like DNA-binding protein